MSTPLSTPVRQAKLGIASTKSLPLANEYKKLLNEQYQRLWMKHQQDLDLIDDIRSYVKARLSIEKEYTSALIKLAKQHSTHISKKFNLLNQCDPVVRQESVHNTAGEDPNGSNKNHGPQSQLSHGSEVSDSRLQKRLANNGLDEPDKPCSLYKVWSEHINRLQSTSKNRADQFEQLIMLVDKLKDIRSHKASIGKKCLDTHLKRIHEDVIVSMVDVEKARKLYYEDESQAKKARENEEKIKKKRSGLLTKFTDLQAKKEKTSAQREANDIQSTQARNDYIMALAAVNAHLQHYYQRDLADFIHLIDDGVLDHCKIFMATLSECDINSLKDSLTHSQYWSKMINLTGSQKTNSIFLECEQSTCLREMSDLSFEPCNNDPIQTISLEHNADYALQHEIDKWFTWFKKECRNLNQLMHQLEVCQRAFAEGKKSIEINGQVMEDLEPKIIELKQQIRKSEAAKLKAQARLKVIKEGGMQIEEWSTVESEIRADMLRAQQELEAKRAKELVANEDSSEERDISQVDQSIIKQTSSYLLNNQTNQVKLQISKDSDDSEADDSIHNLASISRSVSTDVQKQQQQQNAISGYSALTDPSSVWQDDYSNAWGSASQGGYNVVVTDALSNSVSATTPTNNMPAPTNDSHSNRYDHLDTSRKAHQQSVSTSMTVQSSSPLSAIIDGTQTSPSPYQGMTGEAYKSDYECDYNRNSHLMRSTASSVETYTQYKQTGQHTDAFGTPPNDSLELKESNQEPHDQFDEFGQKINQPIIDVARLLDRQVITLYSFDKTNEDDLSFNENEILRVVEVNDENWVKAINESTGEEGFVPTYYIKLLEEQKEEVEQNTSQDVTTDCREQHRDLTSMDSENAWSTQDIQQHTAEEAFCRALYDYEPEADTYEEDGLPHLALKQGELMRIIEQGEDDGWWLVKKEDTGVRGHVPSMLVEELVPDVEDEEDDYGDGVESDYSDDDLKGSVKAMPTFEPPVLPEDECDISKNDLNNNSSLKKEVESVGNSLVATSFIIIEPTPEVESRRVEDSLNKSKTQTQSSVVEAEGRKVVESVDNQPPSAISYSVVNDDFVLEGPARKPYHQSSHHETPTIVEENIDEGSDEQNTIDSPIKHPVEKTDQLPEVDSTDIPAPPEVIIDRCEDRQRERSFSVDDEEEDRDSLSDHDGEHTPTYVQREIKHTGNVDVNPLLRHRAEEFSKQIIAEALMLTPGAVVGPSTSTQEHPC